MVGFFASGPPKWCWPNKRSEYFELGQYCTHRYRELDRTCNSLLDPAIRIEAGEPVPPADYHLNFAERSHLLAELPPRRLDTLRVIKLSPPVSIFAVAKHFFSGLVSAPAARTTRDELGGLFRRERAFVLATKQSALRDVEGPHQFALCDPGQANRRADRG